MRELNSNKKAFLLRGYTRAFLILKNREKKLSPLPAVLSFLAQMPGNATLLFGALRGGSEFVEHELLQAKGCHRSVGREGLLRDVGPLHFGLVAGASIQLSGLKDTRILL